jgi:hypothetical protein
MFSLIDTSPLWFGSAAGHAEAGSVSRAMFTPRINSSIVTTPSPLQSPTQTEAVAVGDDAAVDVDEACCVAAADGGGGVGEDATAVGDAAAVIVGECSAVAVGGTAVIVGDSGALLVADAAAVAVIDGSAVTVAEAGVVVSGG